MWILASACLLCALALLPISVRLTLEIGNSGDGYAATLTVGLGRLPWRFVRTLRRVVSSGGERTLRLLDKKGRVILRDPRPADASRPRQGNHKFARALLRQLYLREFSLRATLGVGDAAADALVCGGLLAVVYAVIAPSCAKPMDVQVRPACGEVVLRLRASCVLWTSIGRILYARARCAPNERKEKARKNHGGKLD